MKAEIAPTDPRLVQIPSFSDAWGKLGVVEASRLTGFDARRLYYLYGQGVGDARGHHCHKRLKQFLICLHGSVRVRLENARDEFSFTLSRPDQGILIPPGCWRALDQFSPDAVVAVVASEEYDESDYIRDYQEFRGWVEAQRSRKAVPYLALDRCHETLHLAIERAVSDVLRSGHYIGGPTVATFENAFGDYCGVEHAVGCGNGLDALSLILEALGIGAGDEVIVPANSFIASALAVTAVGARPVCVDVRPDTLLLGKEGVEAAVTSRTRAIMPVHLYGIPVDMDAIDEVAKRHSLFVVEDAAQAHGAEYKGRRCGGLGHAAAFSFYPTKNLGAAGDGGAVVTKDAGLADKVRMLGNYGARRKYHHEVPGRNTRLDSVQAAVLSVKLPHLDAWNTRRRDLAAIYCDRLSKVDGLVLPKVTEGGTPVWHVFPVRVTGGRRDACIAFLGERGIGTNIHYPIPIHRQEVYTRAEQPTVALPVSEKAATELISLPLDSFHTNEEIERVVDTLLRFMR